MGHWYRVFGSLEAAPEPAGIEACLAGAGAPLTLTFRRDDTGWFSAEWTAGRGEPTVVERWLADEEGIRADLNGWAAFLETCEHGPHRTALMERTIQARQLFTIRPGDRADEAVLDRLCRHLAATTAGFYHAEGVGFFEADGTLLVPETNEEPTP